MFLCRKIDILLAWKDQPLEGMEWTNKIFAGYEMWNLKLTFSDIDNVLGRQ